MLLKTALVTFVTQAGVKILTGSLHHFVSERRHRRGRRDGSVIHASILNTPSLTNSMHLNNTIHRYGRAVTTTRKKHGDTNRN